MSAKSMGAAPMLPGAAAAAGIGHQATLASPAIPWTGRCHAEFYGFRAHIDCSQPSCFAALPSAGALCLAGFALGLGSISDATVARLRSQKLPRQHWMLRRARRSRTARRAGLEAPGDYYGLLGLPRFTSDRSTIRSAHRRVVKLVHPDVLGSDSKALQILVTEAYATLSDEDKRAAYDESLRASGGVGSAKRSRWPSDVPPRPQALFIDQTVCEGCFKCVDVASSTFEVDGGEGSARVFLQYGDSEENIVTALEGCPSRAISLVKREDLPFLEHAMGDWLRRRRTGDIKGSELAGPFEAYQQFQFLRLKVMDFASADGAMSAAEQADSLAADLSGVSEQGDEIAEAISTIPSDVRKKAWPTLQEASAESDSAQEVTSSGEPRSAGRVLLVRAVFRACDTDGDGWLRERELRKFGDLLGFEGSDEDWSEEYRLICMDNKANPMEGVSEMLLLKMVNNDEDGGCYCSDSELEAMVEELDARNNIPV
eukprot:CAMPEP_0170591226 /NCGR_PEP_ID=MMETSP0224-20130122/12290_1 /TAXON_ID=285029 /ORGANISM="Togula jolla, Strain CCCM 725" /LENGTH=484 /DNA_ID=CAMNT_0010915075 /DNA_START=134 /DNA_END=1588 /DNA_ORIENTATION=+